MATARQFVLANASRAKNAVKAYCICGAAEAGWDAWSPWQIQCAINGDVNKANKAVARNNGLKADAES